MSRAYEVGRYGWTVAAFVVLAGADPLAGQDVTRRPVPGPLEAPTWYAAAVAAGTRTPDGRPGPRYWQNRARYDIEARLDPASARLEGVARITYENHSPEAIDQLVLHLHQNLFAPGAMRNELQEVTGGVDRLEVRLGGQTLQQTSGHGGNGPFYVVDGTRLRVALGRELPPGDTVALEVAFGETLPQNGTGRMGHSERQVYFVAYWFPKMAVFDDLRGWDAEPFLGRAEFYDAFDDYRVAITVPAGWTVMATGTHTNPDEVYTPRTLERLAAAAAADTVVTIASVGELRAGSVTRGGGELTYRWQATRVRDFTFTASNVQQWDATSARVPDRGGDGSDDRVAIHAFWRPERAPLWAEQARWGKLSIEHHSRYTDLSYPWPHMTSVEGGDIIGGGMEFPMLTLIGTYAGPGQNQEGLFSVTSHELGHMWIPMIVGTNEKRYAWMDEGSTTFLENVSKPEILPGARDAHVAERMNWLQVARLGLEEPLMRHGDWYESGLAYGTASYPKPASLLWTLRGLLGEEAFLRAYRGFIRDWAFKHPVPWDFFAAFEREAGRDLDWFWQAFYEETWTLDQAVAGVEEENGHAVVVIQDRGEAPAPLFVRIETSAGGVLERALPVSTWFGGSTEVRLEMPPEAGRVLSVEIDPERILPDLDRSNNRWSGS
jgi:hypothetical protein